ncbi:MAG: DUF2341 domain-containing protein, partial [Flavipsychrobacter sp.]|nr:DUF2341 domain-containing protein [Flavipsychrobacter sp.]
MKKNLLFSFIMVCLSAITYAQPAGWLYEKPFAVTNSSPQLILNYTMAVTVNTQALISSGKMQDSGQDIRFGTPCNGTKMFSYFIDSGINTATTLIYVRIDSLKPNSTRTIYMFYGNPDTTAASSYAALDGPYTMFNNVAPSSPVFNYNFYNNYGYYDQVGTYFQPNQTLIVTAIGVYSPSSSKKPMNISTIDGTPAIVLSKTVTPASYTWSFSNLSTPLVITPLHQYAVSEVLNDSFYDYFYSAIPSFVSPQVNLLGYTYDILQSGPNLPPYGGVSSTTAFGIMDIKYYVQPNQNSYVSYIPDTQINGSAYIDPVNKLVCPGTNTNFIALASGQATTYQWQVNN